MIDQDVLPVDIRPVEEKDLDLLQAELSPNQFAMWNQKRYEVQRKNEGLYLIAWDNDIPVGHFLLNWSGPRDETVQNYVDISRTAYLEGGLTKDEYRRKGIATKLIQEAEKLAKKHGCASIGLEVGSKDNPNAKKLYEKLGYKEWGHGDFEISWESISKDGIKTIEKETVTYMLKIL